MVRFNYSVVFFVAGLIVTLSGFYSCDDRETCSGCGDITSTFDGKKFRVFFESPDTFLIHEDLVNGDWTFFPVCSGKLLADLQSENIIVASGSFRNACDKPENLIDLTDVEWLRTCLPPIPQLNGTYELGNRWFIHYVQTPDTLLYPPCEGDSFVIFDTNERSIHSHPAAGSCIGTYTVVNDSTFKMPDDLECTLQVGNVSQSNFDIAFNTVIDRGSEITYSINKNIMVLKNKEDNSMVRLFFME